MRSGMRADQTDGVDAAQCRMAGIERQADRSPGDCRKRSSSSAVSTTVPR